MGMIGEYVAINEKIWQQVEGGEIDILDIDGEKYPKLDIDKAWQAIFFVLCEDIDDGEPPLNYVVPFGGEPLDTDLIGAFYIDADQVKEAYLAIKDMTEDDFRAKYDFEALVEDEVYPIFGDEEDGEEFFEYLYGYFKDIQEYYKSLVDKKLGVIFYIL